MQTNDSDMPVTWSFSALKTFQQCPKRYNHQYVLKDVKDSGSEATLYGTLVHEAIENHLNGVTPLPEQHNKFLPAVQKVESMAGDRYVEYKMALDFNLRPCDFDSPDRFVRGIADVLLVNGKEARVIDWKSSASSRYADPKQLELMALMVFRHFPKVDRVRGGLVFLVIDQLVQATYLKKDQKLLWRKWIQDVQRIEVAKKNGTFTPSPSGLCGYCPVTECEFKANKRR